jgi:hypothetical protein
MGASRGTLEGELYERTRPSQQADRCARMSKLAGTRQWLVDELAKKGRGAQSALAGHLGLHRTAVNKMIEENGRSISADELAQMAQMADFFQSTPPGFEVLNKPSQNSEKVSESKFTKRQPAKSHLDDVMWAIWGQAKPSERQLIVNIANTILASRKEP